MRRRTSILLFICAVSLLLAAYVADVTAQENSMEQHPLMGTEWRVEDIDGAGVVDASHTTIGFRTQDQAGGDTGCNRWFGGYEATETELRFGVLAGTLRACAQSLMDQETKFYAAMERVVAWEIPQETGLLQLMDAEGKTVLRASRVEES